MSACLSCGLWTGPSARKVPFDGGPAQGGAAPPASSTVTTLFTWHKQAGQTPRSEAALCHCNGREAQTNSHIQNDMINQLAAREDGKWTPSDPCVCVRLCVHACVDFEFSPRNSLVSRGFFCQTQAGNSASEAEPTKTSRSLEWSPSGAPLDFCSALSFLQFTYYADGLPRPLFVMEPESFTCGLKKKIFWSWVLALEKQKWESLFFLSLKRKTRLNCLCKL